MSKENFVLDCSVTMAWCFEDEITEYSENALNSLFNAKAIVPPLWDLEVTNVLLQALRKKRITKMQLIRFKDSLSLLPIQIQYAQEHRSINSIMALAEETGLTIYDAVYLELALRQNLPIATLDKTLRQAAKKMNVILYC